MITAIFGHIPAWLLPLVTLFFVFCAVWIVFGAIKGLLIRLGLFFSKNFSHAWGQPLVDQKLLSIISYLIPVLTFMMISRSVSGAPEVAMTLIDRISLSTTLIIGLKIISVFLNNLNTAYTTLEVSKNKPIKGFIQVVLLILYLLVIILVVSILLDKSPLIFLSGLGAMTAVLLLVFRDTLLSLVAGIQLTTNNYIKVGDWIEMPQFTADGEVIEIALNAVRVRNWDKTITVIPTHKFLENSFKNWRGMQESGGRRIKRSIHIDTSSIKFLTDAEIDRFKNFLLLKDYIDEKLTQLKDHNSQFAHDPSLIVNSRRLTNVGTFRAYLTNYLNQHPGLHKDMTIMVRQMAPTTEGLPMEIYAFTKETQWAYYESVQSDIFDHVIAISSEFNLRLFQNPSGKDFAGFLTSD